MTEGMIHCGVNIAILCQRRLILSDLCSKKILTGDLVWSKVKNKDKREDQQR